MILAEHVSYSYGGGGQSVSDLSFHIGKGEFAAILGENGAGKTTTVKLIDGLLKPTEGRMLVNGLDTAKTKVSERARQVGFLFQNPDRQICRNTVRDEIAFGLRAVWGKKEKDRIDERVGELLDLFSFTGDEEPFSLSRGQRQQVALASTLAVKPAVLILDEPTTGLDYRECTRIMEFIRTLNEKEGTTVVMVCHDMEVVLDYARRALVMAGGRLLADGPVREIFRDEALMERASLLPPQIIRIGGRLGGTFAGYCAAMGAHPVGVSRSGRAKPEFERVYPVDRLREAVRDADIVAACLPGTRETYGLISREIFAAMKPGVLFLNVGRGSTVDEDALIDGLRSGHIGGAVLDVFRQEPLPEDSPLWSMDHVILTPHMSGSGWDTDNIDRIYALFRDNFARYLTGEPLRNVVDLRRQY